MCLQIPCFLYWKDRKNINFHSPKPKVKEAACAGKRICRTAHNYWITRIAPAEETKILEYHAIAGLFVNSFTESTLLVTSMHNWGHILCVLGPINLRLFYKDASTYGLFLAKTKEGKRKGDSKNCLCEMTSLCELYHFSIVVHWQVSWCMIKALIGLIRLYTWVNSSYPLMVNGLLHGAEMKLPEEELWNSLLLHGTILRLHFDSSLTN